MIINYDLHIHTVMSPCADELMTPNNVLNMAYLKGLDMIAITDHNSMQQFFAVDKIKESFDFIVIYGVEVTVLEGFHVLCYLPNKKAFLIFNKFLQENITKERITNDYLHKGRLCDEFDQVIGEIDIDFHSPLKKNYKEITDYVYKLGGFTVLAHIDRKKSGILSFVETLDGFKFSGFELDHRDLLDHYTEKFPVLKKKTMLSSSDSHSLVTINEKGRTLELEDKTCEALFKFMRSRG